MFCLIVYTKELKIIIVSCTRNNNVFSFTILNWEESDPDP